MSPIELFWTAKNPKPLNRRDFIVFESFENLRKTWQDFGNLISEDEFFYS